jgi:hypothetical protein
VTCAYLKTNVLSGYRSLKTIQGLEKFCDQASCHRIQKKGLRLIKGVKNRVSCRSLIGDYKILTVTSLYIYEIFCFIKRIRSTQLNIPIFTSITLKENRICTSNYATLLVVKKV